MGEVVVTNVIVTRARLIDVELMKEVLDVFVEDGDLLGRSRLDFYEKIRDFCVASVDGEIVGLSALHVLWEDLAEVRSLAVNKDYQATGIGAKLLDYNLAEAREMGISKVFTLTYRPGFFSRYGFVEVDKSLLPHKVWKDCLDCNKFPNCDEIAMILEF
jgi:amino-acid N-acetyltransferase